LEDNLELEPGIFIGEKTATYINVFIIESVSMNKDMSIDA
jgi:hypothetical protein